MVAVGMGNTIRLAVAAKGTSVVTKAVWETEVITGMDAVEVVNKEADERLFCRARQAASVAQTFGGGSTGPVDAREL